MVQVLCPYCIDMSSCAQVIVKCSLSQNDQYCYNIRFCKEIQKPTMTNDYLQYGCKIKNNYEKDVEMGRRKKTTVETKPVPKTAEVEKSVEKPIVDNKEVEKVVQETTVQPKLPEHKKEICQVNYYSKRINKTSIAYKFREVLYSLFVNGEYHGSVEVEYVDFLNTKNIINIRQL